MVTIGTPTSINVEPRSRSPYKKRESMKKAIQLRVTLWIEGEAEPSHDFARSTTAAVREIISAGAKEHPKLKVKVRTIEEHNDDEEEEDVDESGDNE